MKNTILLFSLIFLLSSCHNKAQEQSKQKEERQLSKLEQLKLLPTDTVLNFYDLSNDSISEFPNLSSYTIKSLDLSHNQIDTIITDYLPKKIVKLDLSYNELKGTFTFGLSEKIDLKTRIELYNQETISELDISHNKLKGVYIDFDLRKLIFSYNDVTNLDLSQKNLEYIDVSHNPNFSNYVPFDPLKVDTVISDNIKNNRPLQKREIIFKPTILYIIRDSVKSNK